MGSPAGWKSKTNSLNEVVKEHVVLGVEALKEMGGGSVGLSHMIVWKTRL